MVHFSEGLSRSEALGRENRIRKPRKIKIDIQQVGEDSANRKEVGSRSSIVRVPCVYSKGARMAEKTSRVYPITAVQRDGQIDPEAPAPDRCFASQLSKPRKALTADRHLLGSFLLTVFVLLFRSSEKKKTAKTETKRIGSTDSSDSSESGTVPYGVGLTSNEGRIAKFGEESQCCRQWHHHHQRQRQRYQQQYQHRQQQQQRSCCRPRQRDKGDNADLCERPSRVFEYTERRDESTRRLHVRSPKLFSGYGGGLLIPSNLLIIGLFLCYLTLPPVQPRQNHHQTCPGCPHQQQQHQHLHEIHRGGSKHGTAPSPDDLRLEAIKHQILTKLGLRTRPDVNRTLAAVPRHLALETLYRAEAQASPQYPERTRNDHGAEYSGEFLYGGDEYSYKNLDQQNEETTTDGNSKTTTPYQGYGDYDTRPGHEPQEEMDDFYARTSEIITFAEP
ncbi:inhibin beta chain, partial [Vespula squamosa]